MRLIFMGTPDYAVPALEALLEAGHDIPLVVCQPDRKQGRGQRLQAPPVKELALKHGLEVFQPTKLKEPATLDKLAACRAEVFVVIAYGRILPDALLALPPKGSINIHASLLPKLRGAAPIQFALWEGHQETGVCSMLIAPELDAGDLLLTRRTTVEPDECFDSLFPRLQTMGAELVVETLSRLDQITPQPQDHSQATYSRLLTPEDQHLDFEEWDALTLYNRYRALSPWPGVYCLWRGKRLKLTRLALASDPGEKAEPGQVEVLGKKQFQIACKSGKIEVIQCQPEGKKPMAAADFINGYQLKTGERLNRQL